MVCGVVHGSQHPRAARDHSGSGYCVRRPQLSFLAQTLSFSLLGTFLGVPIGVRHLFMVTVRVRYAKDVSFLLGARALWASVPESALRFSLSDT